MSQHAHLFPSYTPRERMADLVIHIAGVSFAAIGGAVAITLAWMGGHVSAGLATTVYALALLACLGASAAYNIAPPSPLKGLLRRVDHAAIFILIAATATPFAPESSFWGMAVLWAVAIGGAVAKVFVNRRHERWFVALYLAVGWGCMLAIGDGLGLLPATAVWLMGAGGVLYTAGVPFHIVAIPFANAIWHGFVLAASGCFYAAVMVAVVLAG